MPLPQLSAWVTHQQQRMYSHDGHVVMSPCCCCCWLPAAGRWRWTPRSNATSQRSWRPTPGGSAARRPSSARTSRTSSTGSSSSSSSHQSLASHRWSSAIPRLGLVFLNVNRGYQRGGPPPVRHPCPCPCPCPWSRPTVDGAAVGRMTIGRRFGRLDFLLVGLGVGGRPAVPAVVLQGGGGATAARVA